MRSFVDLTLTLREGMRGVNYESTRTLARDGWNARTLHLYSHAGTHMDAPIHFGAGEGTIDRLPLEGCIGLAHVVNLDGILPRTSIRVDHLGASAEALQAGESLLLRTGWSRFAEDPVLYRDELPRVSEELATWCAGRRVKILGVEPPSVADLNNREELIRIHQILLGGGVAIVESLAHLDRLQCPRVLFFALPLKVDGGDGSPCRAFAVDGIGFPST